MTSNIDIAKAFSDPKAREYLHQILTDIDNDPKSFLVKGVDSYYDEVIKELSDNYHIIKQFDNPDKGFETVERVIDGVLFSVGEEVMDKHGGEILPIGRLYSDNRGLHVRLDLVKPNGKDFSITWRTLSQIEKK